jgi:hypothetical protein
MTSQGTADGRFERAIHRRHVQAAEMAAREMGGLYPGYDTYAQKSLWLVFSTISSLVNGLRP